MKYFGSFSCSLSSEPKGGFCHSGIEANDSAHHGHEAPWAVVPYPLLLSPVSHPVLHKYCKPTSQAPSHFRTFALTAPQPRLGSTLISALYSDFFRSDITSSERPFLTSVPKIVSYLFVQIPYP